MQNNLKYFEDLEVGYRWKSVGRTITESDITTFAGVSGDFNPLHMDEEFAKTTLFQKRVAHGLLGLSIATGLQTTETPWMIMAFMGVDWKFKGPIFIGDTVHYESEILRKRGTSKGGRGIIVVRRALVNQRNETVQEGEMTLMVQARGGE